MHQTTGDLLSAGSELFIEQTSRSLNRRVKLDQFSSNRIDLKILSVNSNDSGLYTCMVNHRKLSSYTLEVLSKLFRVNLRQVSRRDVASLLFFSPFGQVSRRE